MEPHIDLLKFVIQLMVSFASLLGVHVVFRLNSADSAIRHSWDVVDNHFDGKNKPTKGLAPREKFKAITNWVKADSPVPERVDPIAEILFDIFNNIKQKKLIIRVFVWILILCSAVSIGCLLTLWSSSLGFLLGFLILMECLFLFPAWTLYNSSNWMFWAERELEWGEIVLRSEKKKSEALK